MKIEIPDYVVSELSEQLDVAFRKHITEKLSEWKHDLENSYPYYRDEGVEDKAYRIQGQIEMIDVITDYINSNFDENCVNF